MYWQKLRKSIIGGGGGGGGIAPLSLLATLVLCSSPATTLNKDKLKLMRASGTSERREILQVKYQ